jgi:signal transduction histidine kinase
MPMPGFFKNRLRASLCAAVVVLASRYLRNNKKPAPPPKKTDRSHGIIHSASDAIISIDEHQTIMQANLAAAAMFDTTVASMQGQPLEAFIPRDLRALSEPPAGAGLATGVAGYFGDTGLRMGRRATDYAVTGRKASGELFALEGSMSTLLEDDEKIHTIILRDITARKQVQVQLEQSYSQLRQLSSALQSIREEERAYIARELHDDLGQLLAALRLDLTLLQQRAQSCASMQPILHSMDGLIVTAITSLRRIASNLRPRALDEGGLYFALQTLRQEFVQRHPIRVELLADDADLALDDAYSTAIFRIVQEALTNIARHAHAQNVIVALHRIDSQLSISIQDDGRGIDEADMEKSTSFGLLGMRERVWGLRGEISISSGAGGGEAAGTRIDILLPLPGAVPD